jgi:hypothetical protein
MKAAVQYEGELGATQAYEFFFCAGAVAVATITANTGQVTVRNRSIVIAYPFSRQAARADETNCPMKAVRNRLHSTPR